MERRTLLVASGAWLVAAAARSFAEAKPLRRLVFVAPGSQEGFGSRFDAFRSALKALGQFEGRDLSIETVWGAGGTEGLASLAAGVVARKPDLILTASSVYVAAFQKETSTIPIVFATAGNPVEQGFAASLRRPGGNITSVILYVGLMGKIPEVVRDALPSMRRLAILGLTPIRCSSSSSRNSSRRRGASSSIRSWFASPERKISIALSRN